MGTPSPSQPFVLPRALIFLASIWLIGSWILSIGLRQPVHPASASFEPAVRLMLVCLATGLMIAWPLLRLSQSPTPYPFRQTILDLLVLLAMLQVVIWPLRVVTSWSVLRTASIDATLCGWVLIIGALITSALLSDRRGPRTFAMIAAVLLCLAGPAAAALAGVLGEASMIVTGGPLMSIRELGDGSSPRVSVAHWQRIGLLFLAAVTSWSLLSLWALMRTKREVSGQESEVSNQ